MRNSIRFTPVLLAMLATAFLGGCGKKEGAPSAGTAGGPPDNAAAQQAAPAPDGPATAEQVAEEMRGDVDCPADVKTPRAASAPVDDVVGVRPGMAYEDAANLVLCSNDMIVVEEDLSRGFQINTYGQKIRQGFNGRFAKPREEWDPKKYQDQSLDAMLARSGNATRQDMQPGESKWFVATMGMPGQEKVISAAREEWFVTGKNPTVASVRDALVKKYGTPSREQAGGNSVFLTWAYDPLGRAVTETSPLINQCSGTSGPDGGINLNADCGIVVAAVVAPLPDNPDVAQNLQVGVVDQAGGYKLLQDTEQNFLAQENERRTQQTEEAAANAQGPQL